MSSHRFEGGALQPLTPARLWRLLLLRLPPSGPGYGGSRPDCVHRSRDHGR